MFKIKKEDYNSVQFLPDYSSSTMQFGGGSAKKGKTVFTGIVIVILLAVIALTAGVYVYFTYFSPANRFITAFENGDYEVCQELSKNNAFDEGYVAGIESTVIASAEDSLTQYKEGTISSDEANKILDAINEASDNCFSDRLNNMKSDISAVSAVQDSLSEAEDTIIAGKYIDGVDILIEALKSADELNMDIESEVSDIVNTYASNIKNVLFTRFSSDLKNSRFDDITAYLDFITKFVSDKDYTDMRSTIESAKAGTIKLTQAAKAASTVAAEAAREALSELKNAEPQTTGID